MTVKMKTCMYISWHTAWNKGLNSGSYILVLVALFFIKKQFMVRIVNWHFEQHLVDAE